MINIVKNKKTVIFIILVSLLSLQLFAASSYYLGSGLEGKYFTIVTDYQGLSAQEAAWIPDNVKTQLEDYVSRYLGMTNVNNVAKKRSNQTY
mgnify:FL=1